jgi:hypothetical protein
VERRLLVAALALWAQAGWADGPDLGSLRGRWAFDFMAPRKTTCAKVDAALVKRAARAGATCRLRPSEEAYDQAGGEWHTCEGKGFARAVFKTKEQCQSNLANERANGP